MSEIINETVVVKNAPSLNEKSIAHLRSGAGWAKFIAILTIIFCSLMVLCGIFMLVMGSELGSMMDNPMAKMMNIGLFMGIYYIIVAGIGILTSIFLLHFASNAVRVADHGETEAVEKSLLGLRNYFKISGIVLIAMIVAAIIAIFIAIIGLAV